jgi:hypothetical protein
MTVKRTNPMSHDTLKRWRDGFGGALDAWDYISYSDNFALALALSHVLWPTFVERQGCILVENRVTEESFEGVWLELSKNVAAVEGMLNETHLYDLFPGLAGSNDELLADFGRVMVQTWKSALAEQFPGRSFQVELDTREEQYGPTVSLYSMPIEEGTG